jgi:hypothetical protein
VRIEQLSTDAHILDVRDLAVAHHEELGGSREFDTAAVCYSGRQMQKQPARTGMNCWLAYNDDGKAVGYLAATITQNFHSWRRNCMQQMWYVLPEARGSRAAIGLIRAMEEWAKLHECEMIYMGVEHNVLDDSVKHIENIINRLGYPTRGIYAIKHVGV